jgi:DNA invertase Pin-like site-specific DNA recombinase
MEGKRSPMTDLVIGVLAQFARMERESIVQRVRSGLARAKAQGKIIKRPTVGAEENSELLLKYKPVVHDIQTNISLRKIAKIHGISQNTILKVKKAML